MVGWLGFLSVRIRYFLDEKTGDLKKLGDIVKRPKLAETLRDIARYGIGIFYNGTMGDKLVEDIQKRGGIITKQDLMQYRYITFLIELISCS